MTFNTLTGRFNHFNCIQGEPRNKGKIYKMSLSPICYYLLSYNSFRAFLSKKLNQQNKMG